MTDTCVIATRGSQLALWQANTVANAIEKAFPDIDVQPMIADCLDFPIREADVAQAIEIVGDVCEAAVRRAEALEVALVFRLRFGIEGIIADQ